MKSYSDTTIIIPTLNEEQNIEELIHDLARSFPRINIIIADDGSKDKTQEIVKKISGQNKKIQLLDRSNARQHGLTISVLDGIKATTTPFFVVMDADLQHPPATVETLLGILRAGKVAFAVGIRKKIIGSWPLHRRALSGLGRLAGKSYLWMSGKNCGDVLSGFFAAKTIPSQALIAKYPRRFEPKGYKVLFDLLKVSPKNIKIAEIPYTFNERKRGASKINFGHLWYYFRSFFK